MTADPDGEPPRCARPRPRLPLVVRAGARSSPLVDRRRPGRRRCGTTRVAATSTSPASWSTPTSATSTPRWWRRSRSRRRAARRSRRATANSTRGRAAERVLATPRTASTRSSSPTAGPTPTRTRSGWPACTRAATRSCRRTGRTTATPARPWSRRGTGGACRTSTPAAHVHDFGPYLYRSEFWATTPEQECERALHHLERVIQAEGPTSVAAILLETDPRHRRRARAAARLPGRACARSPTGTASC